MEINNRINFLFELQQQNFTEIFELQQQNFTEIISKLQEIQKYTALTSIHKFYFRKNIQKISRNLLPVYYSPDFTGGKIAKKDLNYFILNLRKNFISSIN